MKRVKKFLLWILIVPIGLLLVGIILIRILLPPEKIKIILTNQLAGYLHREVSIENIKIGLFKGIKVGGLKISETPSFKEGTFIETKEFVIKYLLALLKKRLVFNKIVLVAPQIRIEYLADGKFNFDDLLTMNEKGGQKKATGKVEEKRQQTKDKKGDISFLISKIQILRGKINFKDNYAKKFNANLEEINLEIGNINLITPLWVNLSFLGRVFLKEEELNGNILFRSRINLSNLIKKDMEVNVDKLSLMSEDIETNLSGQLKNIEDPILDLDLFFKVNSVNKIKKFLNLSFPPGFTVKGNSTLKSKIKGSLKNAVINSNLDFSNLEINYRGLTVKGNSTLTGEIKGMLKEASINANLDFSNLEISYSDLFRKTQDIPASVKLLANFKETKHNVKQLKIDSLEFLFSTFQLKSKGLVDNLNNPQIEFDLSTNQFSLKDLTVLSKLFSSYEVKGTMGMSSFLKGDLNNLKIKGNFNLDNLEATYEKNRITDLNTKVDFTEQSINVLKFITKIDGADFKIDKLRIQNFKKPDIVFEGSLSELNFSKILFLPPQKQKDKEQEKKVVSSPQSQAIPMREIKTRGKFEIGNIVHSNYQGKDGTLKWEFENLTPDLNRLSGKVLLTVGEGKMQNLSSLASTSESKILKWLFFPIIQLQRLEKKGLLKEVSSSWTEIPYDKIEGDYLFAAGLMTINDFHVYSLKSEIFSNGKIDLIKEMLDLQLSLKLPKGQAEKLGSFTETDQEGRVILTFKIFGSFDNPKVKLKLKKTKEVVKEKIKEAVKEKITEEILKKIDVKEKEEVKPNELIKDKAKDLLENLLKKK